MIKIANVNHQINKHSILDDINLSLHEGQVIALIGPNGAGKSTLFNLMSRLIPLQSGSIQFGDYDIEKTDSQTMARTVSMLAQENHIQGRLRVSELLMFGRYPYHHGKPTELDQQHVNAVIERFELGAMADRFLSTLSGGQRQRALIAMVVCQDTPYLLLDEPLNNLDIYHAGRLMREIRTLAKQQHKTVIFVLHDINQAAQFADTVVMMKSGKIIQTGMPTAVLNQENIYDLFGVDLTVIEHNGRPIIIDAV